MVAIAAKAKGVFIPRGIEVPNLDQDKQWDFTPEKSIKKGNFISGGDVVGVVYENSLFESHKIMCDPKISGKVVETFPHDNYTVSQPVCVVETPSGE